MFGPWKIDRSDVCYLQLYRLPGITMFFFPSRRLAGMETPLKHFQRLDVDGGRVESTCPFPLGPLPLKYCFE